MNTLTRHKVRRIIHKKARQEARGLIEKGWLEYDQLLYDDTDEYPSIILLRNRDGSTTYMVRKDKELEMKEYLEMLEWMKSYYQKGVFFKEVGT